MNDNDKEPCERCGGSGVVEITIGGDGYGAWNTDWHQSRRAAIEKPR